MLPSPTNSDDETHAGFGSLIQKSAACGITVLPASLNCNLLLHISCMTYTYVLLYIKRSPSQLSCTSAAVCITICLQCHTFSAQSCESRLMSSYICLFASLSARNRSAPTGHIVMQFGTGLFFGIYIYMCTSFFLNV
jgi:hypothetical protein